MDTEGQYDLDDKHISVHDIGNHVRDSDQLKILETNDNTLGANLFAQQMAQTPHFNNKRKQRKRRSCFSNWGQMCFHNELMSQQELYRTYLEQKKRNQSG